MLSQGKMRAHALTRRNGPGEVHRWTTQVVVSMGKRKNTQGKKEDIDKPWDTLMKLVMEKGAQAFASLALPGVEVGIALDKELRIAKMEGDFFCSAYLNSLPIILHFEFQRNKDENMDRRVWKYNVAMDIIADKPVYSVLVYLAKEKKKE